MASFEDEEKERQELESRIKRFRGSQDKKREFSPWRGLSLVGSFGIIVAVSLVAGLGIGSVADRHFGTKPWFTLAGIVLGLGAAGKASYDLIRTILNDKD